MKRKLTQLTVVLVALAVSAPGAMALAGNSVADQATPIESCTVISEPGHYVLTQDVSPSDESESACIEIRASDVVLDGDGHSITGNSYSTGVEAVSVQNVTVVDLAVTDHAYNVRFDNVTDGVITNVTSRDSDPVGAGVTVSQSEQVVISESKIGGSSLDGPAVGLRDAAGVEVADNTFVDGYNGIEAVRTTNSRVSGNYLSVDGVAITLESGSENVIENNTIEHRPQIAIEVGGHDNTLRDNAIELAYDGIVVTGSEHTLADNDVTRVEGWAASAEGRNHTFVNNEFSGGEDASGSGGALELAGAGHEVASNDINGVHGVYVRNATGPIAIHHNDLDADYQVRVADTERCQPGASGAAAVEVRANNFTVGNYVGVLNEDDEVLNATNNYWGAESGPSSRSDENVTDPITGTAADGSGAPVSAGVHFDPWLPREPSNRTAG